MGLFKDEDQVVSAVNGLKKSTYKFHRVNSPFPSHKIMAALKLKKEHGWAGLPWPVVSSVFFAGFSLAIFTSVQWDLIVGGKPSYCH